MFIVFEGPDGSGQSTQAGLLNDYFIQKNKGGSEAKALLPPKDVLLTKEPTAESEAGKIIKDILKKKKTISPPELQLLFVEDRKYHLNNVILPALAKGKIVISDRYFFSTIAYGSIDCDFDWLLKINKGFLLPDFSFILKVSPEVCLRRIIDRGEQIKFFEKKEKLAKALNVYLKLPEVFDNLYVIDGEKQKEEIHRDILKILKLS